MKKNLPAINMSASFCIPLQKKSQYLIEWQSTENKLKSQELGPIIIVLIFFLQYLSTQINDDYFLICK